MGLSPFKTSHLTGLPGTAGNPNPRRFKVKALQPVGNHVVARVHYPDCKNYEGDKILLYVNTPLASLTSAGQLDPHFDECELLSPFARFEPTRQGWFAALVMAVELDKVSHPKASRLMAENSGGF